MSFVGLMLTRMSLLFCGVFVQPGVIQDSGGSSVQPKAVKVLTHDP